jgi:hypothetical protein
MDGSAETLRFLQLLPELIRQVAALPLPNA